MAGQSDSNVFIGGFPFVLFEFKFSRRLAVVDTKDGILLKPKLSTFDLFGSGAKYATVEEMKKRLDELRAEDE